MVIEDTLENVGQTVATDVLSWEDVIPVETVNGLPNIRSAIARQNQWCGDNRHTPNGGMTGYVLFPRDPFVERSTVGPPMDAVMKVASESPAGLKGMVSFVMVGCVAYHAPFEPRNAEKHETRFIYWLGNMRPDGMFLYVQPKGVVTTLQLVIFPNGLSAD